MTGEESKRKINLQTRHGGSRESRSRRDRPCDKCRTRKSACVITDKPPCRFCELRGLQCSFNIGPRIRHRKFTVEDGNSIEIDSDAATPTEASYPGDHESPQESKYPISSRIQVQHQLASPTETLSPASERSETRPTTTTRQYLSWQELTSGPETPEIVTSPTAFPLRPTPDRNTSQPTPHERDLTPFSLECDKKSTAHFVGLSGEQDTNLFSSIRYNILNETNFLDFNVRQVYAGNPSTGAPPIHFSILQNTFPVRDQVVKQTSSGAIEAHIQGHGDALIRLYFRFIHPVLPILSKSSFLAQYTTDKLSIPASLRGAIYGLACAFWRQDPILKNHPPIAQTALFEHAHAALNRELDSPKLSTLQACLLIIHEQPDISASTESPRIWVLACQATACAQSLGLHQDPTNWKLPLWEKRLRKRLWWATVMHDIWISMCHGNAPHISIGSFDTSELDMADMASDETVGPGGFELEERDRGFSLQNAARFLANIRLTMVLWGVLKDAYTLQDYRQIVQKFDLGSREAMLLDYKNQVNRVLSTIPEALAMNFPITGSKTNGFFHLSIFTLKFLILRQLMAPATPEAKSDPGSALCKYYAEALQEGEAFLQSMSHALTVDLESFWPRYSRSNLIVGGNHLVYLFFCASTETQVAKAYEMLQKYQDILNKASKITDWSTIGLIRPSLLRTDSFFRGAAEGIRHFSRH
ncbi:hypothetical protein HYFRA_00001592 [Hymenoscyphus fraxineus]|uniref:Zn(2)-C6 fungal-type domain-containing protein n=1 Tax=Hymenoscyphus fraxineus TaxID=746836 RepID=A0A9N9L8X5_9HELO|nr:hypothetical protein HYFRA_00001592 [Hymenoscyphus fraxineus]